MDAGVEIEGRRKQLLTSGVDLGAALGAVEDIGYGGSRQVFERGHIYHHDDVGTAAVYGGILAAYVARNGPLPDRLTGERLLGFPRGDEEDLPQKLGRISRFEWGALVWRDGARLLREPHATRWLSVLAAAAGGWHPATRPIVPAGQAFAQVTPFDVPVLPLVPALGFPAADTFVGADRLVTLFERGLMISPRTGDAVAEADVDLPMIGRPAIAPAGADTVVPLWIRCTDDANGALIIQALSGRVVLVPVAGGAAVPVQFAPIAAERAAGVTATLAQRDHNLRRTTRRAWVLEGRCAGLADRTLYSVAVVGDDGGSQVWAPHAVYARASWSDFGFVHATDLHVARRNDRFYEGLVARDFVEGAKAYQNFNDCFRDLIVTVNRLHAAGLVDVVIATGDLTDFGYDHDDVGGNRGGNFRFVRELLLGGQPSSDPVHRSEPLQVPIFLTPGNHDYRRNPYALYFDLNQDFGLFDVDLSERREFASFNLVVDEVKALQDGRKLDIDPGDAADYLMIDKPLHGYYLELADQATYVTALGPHRLVMLDSRWDVGRILDLIDLGLATVAPTRATSSILGGSPMQAGPTDDALALLHQALVEAGDGLVITGIHAPPFNPWGNHFAHYFRETQPTDASWEDEIIGHLIRADAMGFDLPTASGGGFVGSASVPTMQFSRQLGKSSHPGWFARGADSFFFEGDPSDHLDYGCVEGNRVKLLELCAGKGAPRPIDLLLCGHQHCTVEFRLRLGPTGKLRFYTDFYTQSPYRPDPQQPARPEVVAHARDFYSTVMLADTFEFPTWGIGSQASAFLQDGARRVVRVVVREQAIGGPVQPPTRLTRELALLEIDPYPQPLATTPDALHWWARHRPLILQTGAVGPVENNQRGQPDLVQPTFAGVRVGLVRQNVIDKLHFVSRDQLRPGVTLPWEPMTAMPMMTMGTVVRPHP